ATRRWFPPAISNLTRSRFSTLAFEAGFCTSSVEVQCAALTSSYQRPSETFAPGCVLQKLTSTFRAMILMARYSMFPIWDQALLGEPLGCRGRFRPSQRVGECRIIAPRRNNSAYLHRWWRD